MYVPNQLNKSSGIKGKFYTKTRDFKIWLNKNEKIKRYVCNYTLLFRLFREWLKYSANNAIEFITRTWGKFFNIICFVIDSIVEFFIRIPPLVIEFAQIVHKFNELEKVRMFCFIGVIVNTTRIILFFKKIKKYNKFLYSFSSKGYLDLLRILQLVCTGIIVTTLNFIYCAIKFANLKMLDIIPTGNVYIQQIIIHILITVIWYYAAYEMGIIKKKRYLYTKKYKTMILRRFQKLIKYYYAERYNNRRYNKIDPKQQGNLIISTSKYNSEKNISIIVTRLLNHLEGNNKEHLNDIEMRDDMWEKMDHSIITKILDDVENFYSDPQFAGIYKVLQIFENDGESIQNKDVYMMNLNLFLSIIMCLCIIIEIYLKRRETQKKNENENLINIH